MSNGTITKLTNATVATGVNMTAPSMELLTAMGHTVNTSAATEEFVTMPGRPNIVNTANFTGASYEAKVTAAVAYALAQSKPYCMVNQVYDASLATLNASVLMLFEAQ